MWPLTGKTALVTGGAKRIGRATVLALAGEGANVVVHYRSSQTQADDLVRQIRGTGGNAWAVRADLADEDQAKTLLDRARERAGTVDILINNASIFPENTLDDLTADDVAISVQVNAVAPFLIARALAAQTGNGAIVNFLDARLGDYDASHVAYDLSKRMLLAITQMLALEFAPAVRVNAVAPGLILAPCGEDESYLKRLGSRNPLRRVGKVQNITDAVVFLLQNDFVTGQVIYVDGGRQMKGRLYGR